MHEESICVISIPIHWIWVMLTPFDLLQGHLRSAQKKIKPLVVYQCSFWYGLNTHQKFVNKNKQKTKNFIITWKTCGAVTPSGSSDPLRPTEFWEETKPGQIPTKSMKTKVIDFKTNW